MSIDDLDGNALLFGFEKAKACSFDGPPGIMWEGVVLEGPKPVHQKNYDTEELEYWDDEKTKPKISIVIKIQTQVFDPADPEDTGVRALWVRGKSQQAVAQAMRQAGVKEILPGGYLSVEFFSEVDTPPKPGQAANKKRFKTKLYRASYTPPPSPGNQALMASYPESTHQELAQAATTTSGGIGDVRAAAAQQSAVLAQLRNAQPQNHQGRPQSVEAPF